MRRSFGGGSRGMGGGSGGGGGGSILRTVHRAVRGTGVGGGATHEPFSHATNSSIRTTTKQACQNKSNTIKLTSSSTPSSSNNSSPFSSHNIPISAASSAPSWPANSSPPYSSVCSDEADEWEHIGGSGDERGHGHAYFDEVVFGTVPSRNEVHRAVSALQQVFEPTTFSLIKDSLAYHSDEEADTVSGVGPDSDWIEPSFCNLEALKPYVADKVYDAFHLLNTEPSVQRMVISLSSDKAIWNAVLNNEAVREFRESLNQGAAETNLSGSSDEGVGDDSAKDILSWIVVNIKAKVMELVDKITKLVNEVFQPSGKTAGEAVDPLEEKLRASFLLSVIVLLIVVVTRAASGA